jgi:hypothetical protein
MVKNDDERFYVGAYESDEVSTGHCRFRAGPRST